MTRKTVKMTDQLRNHIAPQVRVNSAPKDQTNQLPALTVAKKATTPVIVHRREKLKA